MLPADSLTHDILFCILDFLAKDEVTLYHCTLVNRTMSNVASNLLYRRVTFSPKYTRTLDLRKRNEFSEGVLYAASLPHNAAHVLDCEISGYLSTRPPLLDPFARHLLSAMRLWRNLTTIQLTPKQYHKDIVADVVPMLRECTSLTDLTVNASCADEERAPHLVNIGGLERLTIYDPTRAILELLPEWLATLSHSLRGFYLRDNCGSVTPGVLRSLAPHLPNIGYFALGLSYSLTDSDVFTFLQQLPSLKQFDFRYYLQLRLPSIAPCLPNMSALIVRHTPISTSEHSAYLCKWIRCIVTHARLSKIRLICEEGNGGANVSFDGLVSHLCRKHADTLRVLRMDTAFVGRRALRKLCATCLQLEELAVTISGNLLAELPEMLAPLRYLRTIRIRISNVKNGRLPMNTEGAQMFLQSGPKSLRRLAVDGLHWEGQWTSTPLRTVVFAVEQMEPWQVQTWNQGYNP